MASSCPLSVEIETPSGGDPFLLSSQSYPILWGGTPRDRAVTYLMPLRAKGHPGMWLFPAPPSLCTRARNRVESSLQGRAAWWGRRLHLPHPCP